MALPTSPNGGLTPTKAPIKKRVDNSSLPDISPATEPKPSSRRPVKKTRQKPVVTTPQKPVDPRGEWIVDPETGVKHRVLPKTEWDPDNPGFSKINLGEETDALFDLNKIASEYLSHLQVPPSPKELKELREEKKKLRMEQENAYQKILDEAAEAEESIEN